MKKDEILLTADWGDKMSDVIGKITFNEQNPKAQLFYDMLKEKPEIMSFGVGYIQNTQTGETELIEVSCYIDMEKIEKQKELRKLWKEAQKS